MSYLILVGLLTQGLLSLIKIILLWQSSYLLRGGTVDCERIEAKNKYIFEKIHLPEMLKQGRCIIDIDSQILMMKDSIYMTDKNREKILQNCRDCKEDKIIITHGTDTMVETA